MGARGVVAELPPAPAPAPASGVVRKYMGLFDVPLSVLSERCYATVEPALNYRAMQAHFSQWVWYRRLFVLFSRYTFLNTLVEMEG